MRELFEVCGVLLAQDVYQNQVRQAADLLRQGYAFDEMLGVIAPEPLQQDGARVVCCPGDPHTHEASTRSRDRPDSYFATSALSYPMASRRCFSRNRWR
ncbi:MAG: hypothetical protein LH632_20410 [Rhodoferax sp.]|nr:hypothetical protein [Rhodoferax sp.]